MKFFKIIFIISTIVFIQSCSSTTQTTKQSDGDTYYEAGNYEQALQYWEQDIIAKEGKGKKAKAYIYMGAGKSAFELNQTDKARKYLESARSLDYTSPELYLLLAKVYKTIDNLSKEITALETYCAKYPEGKEIESMRNRLFATYVESENWDYAVDLWIKIKEQAQTKPELLSGFLIVNKNLGNTKMCNELAQQIIKIESNNIIALEWYAENYFWKAENVYVSEMKAYKNKRTQSQYNKLLKALEKVYPNFRKSRDYFLRLYKMEPKKEYADFLGKIYTRLDDKQKAAYYKKKAK